jgi:ABC-type branched-subunit amino acid transport system substrate-binding protein
MTGPSIDRGTLAAAAVALVGLIAAACGTPTATSPEPLTASAPGITPTNVLIGSDQALAGPAAFGFGEIAPAATAFFAYVNARGGVNGRTITYKYLDDAYNAVDSAKAIPVEQQLVSTDHVFAYFNGFGVLSHAAIVDSLNAQGVPDLLVGSSCACWNAPRQHPETFGFGTNYATEGRLMGAYVARTFPDAKVAYIWSDDLVGCCKQTVAELNRQIPASRVVAQPTFVPSDLQPPTLLLPQLQAARAAGAQVIVVAALATQAVAEILIDDATLGYHPTILAPFRLEADPTTVGRLIQQFSQGRLGPALENGLVTQAHLPPASDSSNPWIRIFQQAHDQYDQGQPFDNLTVYGMTAAALFVQALRQAGRNPTRSSIVATLNRGAIDNGGPGLLPLPYSGSDHDRSPGLRRSD